MIAQAGLDAELVVVEANIRYRLPVTGDIVCHCAVTESARRTFIDELDPERAARDSTCGSRSVPTRRR